MRFTKPSILVTTFFLISILPAHADDQSRLAMARAVVESARSTDSMRQMFPLLLQQVRPALAQQGADQKTVDNLMGRLSTKLEGNIGKFADMVAQVYAREFSEADLTALNAFYQSPAGRNLVSKQVAINQSMATIGSQWGQEIAIEVLQEYVKDQVKASANKN